MGAERPMGATRYWFCVEIPKRTITLYTDEKESIKLLVITHSSQWEKVLTNTGSQRQVPQRIYCHLLSLLFVSLFVVLLLLFLQIMWL